MTVYVVVALSQASLAPLQQAVESVYSVENRMRAGDTCWIVADPLFDIAAVSKNLGIKDQNSGTLTDVLVVWAALYWGFANPQIWAWIAQKLQQPVAK